MQNEEGFFFIFFSISIFLKNYPNKFNHKYFVTSMKIETLIHW